MATKGRSCTLLRFLPLTMLLLPVLITCSSGNLIRSQTKNGSNYYDLCAPFTCGNKNFSFPFSLSDEFGKGRYDCGLPGFQIACDSSNSSPSIVLSGRLYQVKKLFLSDNDRIITVFDQQLIIEVSSGSCTSLKNLTIPNTDDTVGITSLMLAKGGVNLTIFECPLNVYLPAGFLTAIVGNYNCSEDGERAYVWDGTQRDRGRPFQVPGGCRLTTLPISGDGLVRLRSNRSDGGGDGRKLLAEVLGDGFDLEWADLQDCATCREKDGRCGYDGGAQRIVCFCKGGCGGHAFNWKVIVGI